MFYSNVNACLFSSQFILENINPSHLPLHTHPPSRARAPFQGLYLCLIQISSQKPKKF